MPYFRQCFGQKGGQLFSDLNSEAIFGILSSFGFFWAPLVVLYTSRFLTSHAFSKFKKQFVRTENDFLRNTEMHHVVQHEKLYGKRREVIPKSKKRF